MEHERYVQKDIYKTRQKLACFTKHSNCCLKIRLSKTQCFQNVIKMFEMMLLGTEIVVCVNLEVKVGEFRVENSKVNLIQI